MNRESRTLLMETLARLDEVLFAFLFGSGAGGKPRPDSDRDIGVYVADVFTAEQRFDLRRLRTVLQDLGSVDVVILNDAPPLLAQRVLQGASILIRDRSAYMSFFVRTAALAGDEQYWRRLYMQARNRRLEEGRFDGTRIGRALVVSFRGMLPRSRSPSEHRPRLEDALHPPRGV